MMLLGREVSSKVAPMIIAEISCNHEGNFDFALSLIKKAKSAGADAVKIQCYTPDEMTINHRKYTAPINGSGIYEIPTEFFCEKGPWNGQHLYDLYHRSQTPPEWVAGLFNYAKEINFPIFASVFGEDSLKALEAAGCPAYKIASFEVNDTNLLRMVAKTQKPIILSTGACTQAELDRALNLIIYNTIVMHCVSKYPTRVQDSNLSRLAWFRYEYGDPVGFSDHTKGSKAAMMAIALGACILEKHFGNSHKSADKDFSLSTDAFRDYVLDCHDAWQAMQLPPKEEKSIYRRSLYVVEDVKEGQILDHTNVRSIRPGFGMDPDKLSSITGRKARFNLPRGTALKEDMLVP